MSTPKQPTPRTDAMVKAIKGWNPRARAMNLAYLCRILDRELSAARAQQKDT